MKKITYFIPIVIVLTIVACNQQSSQYDTISKATRQSTTIELHWVAKNDISDVCTRLGAKDSRSGLYNGCARSKPSDLSICEIYVTQPNSFDDTVAIAALGHETWHCLGAKHM